MIENYSPKEFHFSGHDTFHLRYSWLPKAAQYIRNNPGASFNKYESIMIELGIGKNMANSLRHWVESSLLFNKIKSNSQTSHELSEIGKVVLTKDKYFENIDSVWLVHYLIASNHKKNALWFYLFNIYNDSIIIKDEFLFSAISWFKNQGVKINERSIERDFQCCMNMYDCSKIGAKKIDDLALSSPFRELKLIKKIGNNYKLKQLSTPEISPSLVSFCILNYLEASGFQKFTPFADLLNGIKSPGRVLRLTENLLLKYLGEFQKYNKGYEFDSTAGMQQLIKNSENRLNKITVLNKVYE